MPTRPFKVIALLTCEGARDEEAVMTNAIHYRAKLMGADAVIAGAVSAQDDYNQASGHRGSRRVYRARAVVYEDK